jgi:hypothetical protein
VACGSYSSSSHCLDDAEAAQRLFEEGMAVTREFGNPVLMAVALDGFAAVAAAQRQGRRALRLAALAARLRECPQISPAEQESLRRNLPPARELLGDDASAAAWAAGQAISEEQALAYALGLAESGS